MRRIFCKERHVTVYLLLSVLIMCSYLYIAISRAGLPDNPQYECVKQVDDYSLYKISQQ